MTFLKSLPENAALLAIFQAFPQAARSLIDYHETVLRGPSPLTVAERELIAAFVSTLNACNYCAGIHAAVAEQFDIDATVLSGLVEDIDTSNIDQKLKPVFRYARKLTQTPSQLTQRDADAIFAAGWDDQALHDIVAICALFNFMNRFVEGLGVTADAKYTELSSQRLSKNGYSALSDLLD